MNSTQQSVAVIGGGITGLTAAFQLKRAGFRVALFESGDRVGGVIQSRRQEGYLAEFGPNTILETSPMIAQLVRDAGVESRRLNPDPKASARYLVRHGRPIAMPSATGFFSTDLFSFRAKLAVLREPFVPRRRGGSEESIAQFVRRRLNREFLDHAVDALVAGIYAGDPEKLSLPHAFPKLARIEEKYGSLIKGQILGARARRKSGEVAKDRAPKFSFDEGLQVLTDAIAAQLGESVRLRTCVTRVSQTGVGWTVLSRTNGNDEQSTHGAVIYAGTAFRLAELSIEHLASGGVLQRLDLSALSEIRYPPVTSIVLGFRRGDVGHPCEGFGMLIPKVEGFRILGTIFSSSLFPNRAPSGHLTLTTYIGGERFPELASKSEDELTRIVTDDLGVLLGVRGHPTFRHIAFYPRAIPQYNVGYGRYRELMDAAERRAAGLFLAGHYRDGVSLSDSILSGMNVVSRVKEFLFRSDAAHG